MMRIHLCPDLPEPEDLLARPELGLVAPLRAHLRLVQETLAAPRELRPAQDRGSLDGELLHERLRELTVQHLALLEHVLATYQEALERFAEARARERSARPRAAERAPMVEDDGSAR
jgi:hypothetical protein